MKALLVPVFFLCASSLFAQTPALGDLFRIPDFGAAPAPRESPVFVPLAAGTGISGNSAGGVPAEKTTPLWVKDLRRGEIVAFGSLPLTIFWVSTLFDLYRMATHNWSSRYAPWPLKGADAVDMTRGELITMFSIAVSSSVLIAVVDHIIVRQKRRRKPAPIPRQIEKLGTGVSQTGFETPGPDTW